MENGFCLKKPTAKHKSCQCGVTYRLIWKSAPFVCNCSSGMQSGPCRKIGKFVAISVSTRPLQHEIEVHMIFVVATA